MPIQLLEVEGNRQIELYTYGFATLFSGLPLGHSLDNADSFLTTAASDITEHSGVSDRTVFLNNEGYIHLTGDVVFLCNLRILDGFTQVSAGCKGNSGSFSTTVKISSSTTVSS